MGDEATEDRYAPSRYSQNFDDTITVLVGPEESQRKFVIYKHLICDCSKFFNAACSKVWAEGKERVVRLPEAKAVAFQAYDVWVYTGNVVIDKLDASGEFRQTVELYLLGDILDDLRLRNESMKTLVVKRKSWTTNLLEEIWDSTTSESRLRQMIVDMIIMRGNRKNLPSVAYYPKDLLHALTLSLLKQVNTVPKGNLEAGLEKYLEPEVGDPEIQAT